MMKGRQGLEEKRHWANFSDSFSEISDLISTSSFLLFLHSRLRGSKSLKTTDSKAHK